jgi:hypothetical protein
MSSKPPIEPPAVKKRGRPKKVVAENAGPTPEVAASKAAVKKVAAKAIAKDKVVEVKKEKKVAAKSGKTVAADAATVRTVRKKIAVQSTIAPDQATPVSPSTSKILEEVQAKGTLKRAQQSRKAVEKEVEAGVNKSKATPSQTQATTPPNPAPSQSKPAMPTNPPLPNDKTPATFSSRATTITLPRKPTVAPSPIHPSSSPPPPPPKPMPTTSSSSFSRPHNPYPSTIRPSPSQPQPRPLPPPYHQHHQHPIRIIEPTPDIRLPPKYKPAARRVTAIIVGLPIVFVVGYELFERWRGKDVRRKFVEDREVLKDIDRRREA